MPQLTKYPSHIYSYILSMVAIVGIPISALFASDTHWQQWHLSRLGEGGSLSAFIFNSTLICGAGILLLIADAVIYELKSTQRTDQKQLAIFHGLFMAVGICWLGLAIFPFDRFSLIHNIFGYSMFVIICAMMIGMPKLLTQAPRSLHRGAIVGVVLTSVCMTLHLIYGTMTLLMVEAFGGIVLFAWLIGLTRYASQAARL